MASYKYATAGICSQEIQFELDDEITAIAEGDADLTAGCTLHPGNFQWIMAAAIENAK